MSFFRPDNQKIIYDHVCKLPQFKALFPPNLQNAGKGWFDERMQVFAQTRPINVSNTEELRQLNRTAFEFVLQSLFQNQNQNQNQHNNLNLPGSELTTVYSRGQPQYSEYEMRQRDYEQMLQKPAPVNTNFPKSLKDEPIDNLEEEIRRHMLERDNIPIPVGPVPLPVGPVPLPVGPVPLPVGPVPLSNGSTTVLPFGSTPQKKHIHWEDADAKMVKIEGEIQSMREKMDLFLNKLDIILEKYNITPKTQTHVDEVDEVDEKASNEPNIEISIQED